MLAAQDVLIQSGRVPKMGPSLTPRAGAVTILTLSVAKDLLALPGC